MSTTTATLELPGYLAAAYGELLLDPLASIFDFPPCGKDVAAEDLPELIRTCRAAIRVLDVDGTIFDEGCLQNARRMLVWAERRQQEVA